MSNGNDQSRAFSKGIFKSVYLVPASTIALTDFKPLVYYSGSYPTEPLTDVTAAPFTVVATAYFWAPSALAAGATLSVASSWGQSASVHTGAIVAGENSVNVSITASPSKGEIRLWWANEMGAQPLYEVRASLSVPGTTGEPLQASRTIGFRVLHLVTADDSDPSVLAGANGSGNTTMRFKLNGANIYARGGNMIPMEEMEGRQSAAAYTQLVKSAAEASFNVFRVWGGGIYLPEAFYDATDRFGILLYHDVMFGSDGRLDPTGSATEDAELRYQVRRLSNRPSIAIWSGCNECGGRGMYESFVAPLIAQEDPSRPVWPSCPSAGWSSGVDRLTGLPNGQALVTAPQSLQRVGRLMPEVFEAKSATCTSVAGADYAKGFLGTVVPTADAAQCCEKCSAAGAENCFAASFYNGQCFFKPPGRQFTINDDVTSVFPAGSTPPAGPMLCGQAESHGPYTHGYSDKLQAVNGQNDPVTINLPPAIAGVSSLRGPAQCGQFSSEFGASVMSSFESMAPTLAPEHWALWGGVAPAACSGSPWGRPCNGTNPMAQRKCVRTLCRRVTHFAPYGSSFAATPAITLCMLSSARSTSTPRRRTRSASSCFCAWLGKLSRRKGTSRCGARRTTTARSRGS